MKKKRLRNAFLLTGELFASALMFLTNAEIKPAPSVLLFLGALTLASALGLLFALEDERMQPYFHRRLPLCSLVSAYASFASFGYRLFLSGTFLEISAKSVAYFALGAVWFLPVVISILYLLEIACDAAQNRRLPDAGGSPLRIQLAAGAVCFFCLLIGLYAFYPGAYPVDAMQQFAQARGNFALRDAHPVMHTMIIRLLLSICDSEVFVVVVQMLCFAALVGRASVLAWRLGLRARILLPAVALFSLLPNQILFHICPLKDVMFTSAMLWGTLLFIDLARDVKVVCRLGYRVELTLCMLMIGTLRHNGLAPMALMMVLLGILTFRFYKKIKLHAMEAVCVCLALLGLWRGPVTNLLGAAPNNATPYLTMFCAVGSVINKGGTLSEESMKKLESVMPLEDWAAYYSRFSGHDGYMFFRPGGMDLTGFSASEALSVYWDALTRYPGIVIKDRLDGSNLLWDVTQPEDSFNAKGFDYMHISAAAGFDMPGYSEGEYYVNTSRLAGLYRRLIDFTVPGEEEMDQLTNMILWRPGAWQIFLLVLMLFWSKRNLRRMYIAAVPLVGNNLIWIFGLYYQAFRYVYYVQVLTLVLVPATFLLARERSSVPS